MTELDRLKKVLLVIEMMTATGNGLTPDECMAVHLLATEGRADDPSAWRMDEGRREAFMKIIEVGA